MLSDLERAVVAAAADALFPAHGPVGRSGTEAGAVGYLEIYLARARGRTRRLMRLMLVFVELSPLVFGPRRRRFSRLSSDERAHFLEDSSSSDVYLRRVVFITLRVLLTMAYFADPQVISALGIGVNTDPFGLGTLEDSSESHETRREPPPPVASETRLRQDVIDPNETKVG